MTTLEVKTQYEKLLNIQNNGSLKYSAKIAYAIMRNIRKMQTITEDYETAIRGIYNKYGTPIKDQPGYVQIPEDNRATVEQEIQELNDTENDIKLMMISIDDLRDLKLTISDMEALYPMIKEEEG